MHLCKLGPHCDVYNPLQLHILLVSTEVRGNSQQAIHERLDCYSVYTEIMPMILAEIVSLAGKHTCNAALIL